MTCESAYGTYTMYGGSLSVTGDPRSVAPQYAKAYGITGGTGIIVGNAGVGYFSESGSSVSSGTFQTPHLINPSINDPGVEGDVVIGAQANSQGTYSLTGSSSLTVNGSIIIGRDAGSNASTTPGGSPVNPNFVIQGDSNNEASFGVFFNGGSNGGNPLSSDVIVGLDGNGAVLQGDNTSAYMDGDLSIGVNKTGVGSYTLNGEPDGGTISVGNFLNIGGVGGFVNGYSEQTTTYGGTGTFTQNSGDVNVVQDVFVGNNTDGTSDGSGTGTYTISGTSTLTANGIAVGSTGNGTFTQTGSSTVTVNNDLAIGVNGGRSEFGRAYWSPAGYQYLHARNQLGFAHLEHRCRFQHCRQPRGWKLQFGDFGVRWHRNDKRSEFRRCECFRQSEYRYER